MTSPNEIQTPPRPMRPSDYGAPVVHVPALIAASVCTIAFIAALLWWML